MTTREEKEAARAELKALCVAADKAERVAKRKKRARDIGIERFQGPLTYEEIARIAGISPVRVHQVIRARRQETEDE